MPYTDPERKRESDKAYRKAHKGQERYLSYGRAWKERNKEKVRENARLYAQQNKTKVHAYGKQYRKSLKVQAFQAYGGANCACCGENHIEFLSIDHMNGGGNEHRRQIGLKAAHPYKWLKDHNYPSGFRVLCMNCNFALGAFGYCPHGKLEEPPKPFLQANSGVPPKDRLSSTPISAHPSGNIIRNGF